MDTFIKINLAFLGFACAVGFSALLIMAMGAVERFLQKYIGRRIATIIVGCVTLEIIAFAISLLASW